MMTNRVKKPRFVALVAALGLTLAACGSDGPDASGSSGSEVVATAEASDADHDDEEAAHDDEEADGDHDGGNTHEEFNFGEPADAADADRVIEIVADDDFTFDPDNIVITAGETVTFIVENVGKLPHDFTLGDAELQAVHDEEMAEMQPADMEMHPEPNAFVIQAGETKELTWHFSESVDILFGCHIPGHYAAGMKGEITVNA